MTKSADPDQLATDLDLHCLHGLLVGLFSIRRVKSETTFVTSCLPTSVAQLDSHPTDDQVMGSIPTWSGSILLWRLIVKYFLW